MGSVRNSSVSELARNTSFSGVFRQIDDLATVTEKDYNEVRNLQEITRQHWKLTEGRTSCFNRECRKQFSAFLDRPHHCRRCGEVFCADCLKFFRRLNKIAHPDPDGVLYKVCKVCFEHGKLTDGQIRSHTLTFMKLRTWHKENAVLSQDSLMSAQWRAQLNLDRECQRLLQGFRESIGNSELKQTLHEMRSMLSTPAWMKSSVWLKENKARSTMCQFCLELFGFMNKKRFCRVCGITVCKSCSTKDLLLYIPNEDKDKGTDCVAKMAIIKIIGCPDREPEISLYMCICSPCKDKLIERQVGTYEDQVTVITGSGFMDDLKIMDEKFQMAESKVRDQLPKYKEIVDSLEDGSRRTSAKSNMKILSKAQEDLADALVQHVTLVQRLKELKSVTDREAVLHKKYIMAKCDFYLNNMSDFRCVKRKLSDSVPAESLDVIQRTIDKNSIVSTHLYLKQLVYEIIYLCDKYKLDDSRASFLIDIEVKVDEDVRNYLRAEKEDVEEHTKIIKDLIHERMKTNRLIRPSKSQLERRGSQHVYELMNLRMQHILTQVNNQLQVASANRSFQGSKRALEEGLRKLKQTTEGESEEEKDFVFVDKDL